MLRAAFVALSFTYNVRVPALNHCMIDIETMGQRPNAPVLSIGAVKFDPNTGKIGQEFYAAVSPADAFLHGSPDGDTLKWWMGQADAARASVVSGTDTLAEALGKLAGFYGNWGNVEVWGNGPSFDMTILEYAFNRALGAKAPWQFWNVRDCRTVASIAGKRPPRIGGAGVYHNALDDARHQAKWVSEMWMGIKGTAAAPVSDDLIL